MATFGSKCDRETELLVADDYVDPEVKRRVDGGVG